MTYYVLVEEWCEEYDSTIDIVGVYKSHQKASKVLRKRVNDNPRRCAEECNWTIEEDSANCFNAGENGFYDRNHVCVYIKEIEGE